MKDDRNNNQPKIAVTPTLKKKVLPFKIALGILCAILFGIVLSWLILFETGNVPYFYEHFAGAIALVLLGCIILLLPQVNKQRIAGDTRGDSLMVFLGFACFILAILTLIFSFSTNFLR